MKLHPLVRVATVLLATAAAHASAQTLTTAAASAPDLARGRQAYVMCATCHGAQGQGMPAVAAPALGGQLPAYVERQLLAYRSGQRGTHADDVAGNRMRMLAKSIPDEALIADLAAHIATLPAPASDGAVRGHIETGRKLYQSKCAQCHGAQGQGRDLLKSPRVAGLGDLYTLVQLQHFKQDRRAAPGNELGQQMTQQARLVLHDDAALRNVVAYLATLAR